MNEKQLKAATAVEQHKTKVRNLSAQLAEAERALKRAEARLRSEARKDPASWNSVTAIPNQQVL